MKVSSKLRLTAAAMVFCASMPAAHAQSRRFDIPAQPATTGIQALGTATGLQIIAAQEDLRDARISPVRGEMSSAEAIQRALDGSGLEVVSDDGRTLVIKRISTQPATAVDEPAPEEIVVTGIRQSLDQSIDVRRQSNGIVDAIVAEDIGKLPDQNVVETLQRIPGVQISRVQGEGSDFVIRGISQNQIQFNGAMLGGPTSDGSGRLQEFNPEILGGLQVIKSPSADTTEGALGGTINLVTKKPLDLDRFVVSGRAQGSYHDRADRAGYQVSGMISARTEDRRLGVLLGLTRHDYIRGTHSFDSSGWTLVNSGTANQLDTNNDGVANGDDQRNVYRPLRMVNNLLWVDNVRNGYNAAIQFRPTEQLELSVDSVITDTMINLDALRLQAILTNAATDVTVDDHGTVVKATYTNPSLRPAIFQETYDTRQEIHSVAGKYESGSWLIEARGTHSNGTRESFQGVPLLIPRAGLATSVTTDFVAGGDVPTFQLTQNYDALDPANWRLESNYETLDVIDSESDEAKLDATYHTGRGWIDRIKVGARYQSTDLSSLRRAQNPSAAAIIAAYPQADSNGDGAISATELSGVAFSGLPGSNFLSSVSGDTVRNWLAGTTDFNATRAALGLPYPEITLSTVRAAKQEQTAGFVMLGLDGTIGGLDVKGDAGVRHVRIDRTSGGYLIGDETRYQEYDSTFDYWLPSINLRTFLTSDLQARLSAAKVIANPSLTSVAPGLSLNQVSFTASRGNPDLKPFEATQVDVALEWYFAPSSALASTLFYKDINSFTVNTVVEEYFENGINSGIYRVTQPANGDSGSVQGVEVSYQQAFPDLPGVLAGSGVLLSYTFADSDTPLVNSLTGEKDPLPGLSRHSFNASAFLEQHWGNVRLTYNWRDSYLDTVQTRAAGGNLYAKDYGQLDASFQYNLSDRFKLNADLLNITGAANRTYVGHETRMRLYEVNDRRVYLGIRASF